MSIYFINEHHKENFLELTSKFHLANIDGEYQSACYIASHPGIYECFDITEVQNGPFDWFYEEEHEGKAFLTGATRQLVLLGLHLWNRYIDENFDLVQGLGTWGDNNYKVFKQAVDLRRSPVGIKKEAL